MSCEEVKHLLWDYLEKETTAKEAEMIEKHLEICEDCSHEMELQREVMHSLYKLAEEDLPPGYHDELMAKLRTEADMKVVPFSKRKSAQRKGIFRQWGMIAAAVFVLAAVGGVNGLLHMRESGAIQKEMLMRNTAEDGIAEAESNSLEMQMSEDGAEIAKMAERSVLEDEIDTPMSARAIQPPIPEVQLRIQGVDNMVLAEIQRLVAENGGYEVPAEADSIYAYIPLESYAVFIEAIGAIGEIEWIEVQAAEGASYRIIQIYWETA